VCRLCGLPLFKSDAKVRVRHGWPSFSSRSIPEHVAEITDRSHGHDARRDPLQAVRPPTSARVRTTARRRPTSATCLNSVSLRFVPAGEPTPLRS